jgi:hypothetical protein
MALMMYLPLSLQRRMMLGGMLPIAVLAAPLIERWLYAPALQVRRLAIGLLLLPLSNLIVLGAMARVIQTRDPLCFLAPEQASMLDWLSAHAAPDDVVLAPPELSRWIPGYTGARVVYGHPMETPYAAEAWQDVIWFYQANPAAAGILRKHSVRWIYCPASDNACPFFPLQSAEQSWTYAGARLYHISAK